MYVCSDVQMYLAVLKFQNCMYASVALGNSNFARFMQNTVHNSIQISAYDAYTWIAYTNWIAAELVDVTVL